MSFRSKPGPFSLFSMIKTAKHLEKYTTNVWPLTTFNIWKLEHKRNFHIFPITDKRTFIFISFLCQGFTCLQLLLRYAFLVLFPKHLRSSRSHWRAASWSCGWRKSSRCPGSCGGRTGWSRGTGLDHKEPRAPGWRESAVVWWVWLGTQGTLVLVDRAGSGVGTARSEGSRWTRTGLTWVTGCGSLGRTAEENNIDESKSTQ